MNPDWQNFLAQHHASIEDGIVQYFGEQKNDIRSAGETTVVCDLGQFGLIRASGEDGQSFLQNLLSNDIKQVDSTHAQLSSFNTAKGRMLTIFTIWRDGEDYLLQLPVTLLEAMRKKLSMYVLRAKVKITHANNELISIGVAGSKAETIMGGLFEMVPVDNMRCQMNGHTHVLKLGHARYQLTMPVAVAPSIWEEIAKSAKPVGSICWDWLNIRSGIPVILPSTQEEFVPQMANLDVLNGINFKKGCYPGQEIVARMHYLGKLKRRMYLAHLDSDTAPQTGEELFSADMQGQASGMITNVAPAPDGGYDILAVIQISSVLASPVHTSSGAALNFLTLPYSVT